MKKTILKFKKQVFFIIIALAGLVSAKAQCSATTTLTNQGNGNVTLSINSTFTNGYYCMPQAISFGDGSGVYHGGYPILSYDTSHAVSYPHTYMANGTYIIQTQMRITNPADTLNVCLTNVSIDTVVITGIVPPPTPPCSIGLSQIYSSQSNYSVINYRHSSHFNTNYPLTQTTWTISDSVGNVLYTAPGQLNYYNSPDSLHGYTYVDYIYPHGGYYRIHVDASSYNNLLATNCSALRDTVILVDTFQTGICNLQVNLTAVTTGLYSATFNAQSSAYTENYFKIDGQIYANGSTTLSHNFPTTGNHNVCYYVRDSSISSNCIDSMCIIYNVAGPSAPCNAYFVLWQDSTLLGNWNAINYSTGVGNLTYSWDFGDGTTSNLAYPTHNYAVPGNYIICLTISDSIGCSSSDCDSSAAFRMSQQNAINAIIGSFTVYPPSASVGVSENQTILDKAKIFPVPMTDVSTVTLNSNLSASGKIEIYSLIGTKVFSQEISINNGANEFKLNTAHLASGVYYIAICSENKTLTTLKAIR